MALEEYILLPTEEDVPVLGEEDTPASFLD
jgi:hypothetical protein